MKVKAINGKSGKDKYNGEIEDLEKNINTYLSGQSPNFDVKAIKIIPYLVEGITRRFDAVIIYEE